MKKTKKISEKDLNKKKKVLTIIKWCAVGLGWSALCAAFIGLLCIGIRGCKSNRTAVTTPVNVTERFTNVKNKKLAHRTYGINDNANDYYYIRDNIVWNNDIASLSVGSWFTENVGDSYFIYGQESKPFDTIQVSISSSTYSVTFYNYDLDEEEYLTICEFKHYKSGDTNNGWTPLIQGFNFDFNVDSLTNFKPFLRCLTRYDGRTIHFNNVINGYGPLGMNNDYFHTGSYSGAYTLFSGLFKTNYDNVVFKEVGIYYSTDVGRYGTATEYQQAPSGVYGYDFMYYRTLEDNRMVVVNLNEHITATAGAQAGNGVRTNSNYWLSSVYQDITIIATDSSVGYGSTQYMDRVVALSTLNNNAGGYTGIGGSDLGGGNPLALIGQAFNGLTVLFGLSILPGITLGVLLFLPLTAGIVLAIVKVVKK